MEKEKLSIQYLAGFFDGEGTFIVGKQAGKNGKEYKHFSIMLSQSGDTGLELLKEIQKKFGGKIYHHLKVGQYKATKNAYKLYWNKDEGRELIHKLLPNLIIKQVEAQAVLDYIERAKRGTRKV